MCRDTALVSSLCVVSRGVLPTVWECWGCCETLRVRLGLDPPLLQPHQLDTQSRRDDDQHNPSHRALSPPLTWSLPTPAGHYWQRRESVGRLSCDVLQLVVSVPASLLRIQPELHRLPACRLVSPTCCCNLAPVTP